MIPPLIKKVLPPPTIVAQNQTCIQVLLPKGKPVDVWIPSYIRGIQDRIKYLKVNGYPELKSIRDMPPGTPFSECYRTRQVKVSNDKS
jgi:hypothetical protein